jgi:hypothetical protein
MDNRASLRIADLKGRTRLPMRMMNVRLPTPIIDVIDKLAADLGRSKNEVVVALLNSGLDQARARKKRP